MKRKTIRETLNNFQYNRVKREKPLLNSLKNISQENNTLE